MWHTDTKGAKDVRLVLQDDRNLVLYATTARPGRRRRRPTSRRRPRPRPRRPRSPPRPPRNRARLLRPHRRHRRRRHRRHRRPPRTYTVVSGDTLWAISERFYGDGNKYQRIADASGVSNPDLIHPGQVLTIP